jgi:hypothetical protein
MKTVKSQLLTDFFECALAHVMKLAAASLDVAGRQTASGLRMTPKAKLGCL